MSQTSKNLVQLSIHLLSTSFAVAEAQDQRTAQCPRPQSGLQHAVAAASRDDHEGRRSAGAAEACSSHPSQPKPAFRTSAIAQPRRVDLPSPTTAAATDRPPALAKHLLFSERRLRCFSFGFSLRRGASHGRSDVPVRCWPAPARQLRCDGGGEDER